MDRWNPFWPRMFVAAALFNFAIGVPILVAPQWTYDIAYTDAVDSVGGMTLRFWRDFGFAVVIIGTGYYLVSRRLATNTDLVWIGILAKLFDVVVLTYRFAIDVAESIVLLPALIDGIFVILFALFLVQARESRMPPPRSASTADRRITR